VIKKGQTDWTSACPDWKCHRRPCWTRFPTHPEKWQWRIERHPCEFTYSQPPYSFLRENLCLDQKKNNSKQKHYFGFWTLSLLKWWNSHTFYLSIQPKPELYLLPICIPWKISTKRQKLCFFLLMANFWICLILFGSDFMYSNSSE